MVRRAIPRNLPIDRVREVLPCGIMNNGGLDGIGMLLCLMLPIASLVWLFARAAGPAAWTKRGDPHEIWMRDKARLARRVISTSRRPEGHSKRVTHRAPRNKEKAMSTRYGFRLARSRL